MPQMTQIIHSITINIHNGSKQRKVQELRDFEKKRNVIKNNKEETNKVVNKGSHSKKDNPGVDVSVVFGREKRGRGG